VFADTKKHDPSAVLCLQHIKERLDLHPIELLPPMLLQSLS